MIETLGEAMAKGGPVVLTSEGKVPEVLYTLGKEAEALKLLELKGIIKLLIMDVQKTKPGYAAHCERGQAWLTSVPTV